MNRLFGKGKDKAPAPSLDDANKKIEGRAGELEARIKKLDQELIKYRDQIKKTRGATQQQIKQRAMRTLQQKKQYMAQLDQLRGQSFNMFQIQNAKESMEETKVTVDAMKAANKQLKKDFKKMDIGKIEDMQYDMEDLMDMNNEIQEVMGRTYGTADDVDEDELDDELAALEDEFEFEEENLDYLDDKSKDDAAVDPFADTPSITTDGETKDPVPEAPMNTF